MLTSLGVKNLRSFTNECHFNLAPITVFVGRNSSGKSSLLRTLPLMRQSFEANTTGPILWYGRLVDFGDFDEAISKNCPADSIEFSFGLTLSDISNEYYSWKIKGNSEDIDVVVKLTILSSNKKTVTKEICIIVEGIKLNISIGNDGAQSVFYFENKSYKYQKSVTLGDMGVKFLPSIVYLKTSDENGMDEVEPTGRGSIRVSPHPDKTAITTIILLSLCAFKRPATYHCVRFFLLSRRLV